MEPLKKHCKQAKGGEKAVEYEIKLQKNSVPLSDGEKKTLTDSCAQSDPIQAAYFHMRSMLMAWKRRLLFDPLAKPDPRSAPEIISMRVFSFVERSAEIESFKEKLVKKGISKKVEKQINRKKEGNL